MYMYMTQLTSNLDHCRLETSGCIRGFLTKQTRKVNSNSKDGDIKQTCN